MIFVFTSNFFHNVKKTSETIWPRWLIFVSLNKLSYLFATCAAAIAVAAILVLVKGETIVVNMAINKVENLLRIDVYAHKTSLKMQVGTGAATSVSTQGDRGACFNILVRLYKEL